MECYLYTFSKKQNSTKIPTNGTLFDINFLSPTDMLNPNIELILDSEPYAYNYAYIWRTHRYYFVSNWTWDAGRWIASLSVDALASWRTEIGKQNIYVLRAYSGANHYIKDPYYPITNNITVDNQSTDDLWTLSQIGLPLNNGTFVIGLVSDSGIPTYYMADYSRLTRFIDFIYSDEFLRTVSEGWSQFDQSWKTRFNPIDYITSIIWLPLTQSIIMDTPAKIGYWDAVALGAMVGTEFMRTVTFSLPDHPQSTPRAYLNYEPYSNYSIYVPRVGIIQLPSDLARQGNNTLTVRIDGVTGRGVITITSNAGTYYKESCTIGVPIPLSGVRQASLDSILLTTSLLPMVTNLATGNIAGAGLSAVSASYNISQRLTPQSSSIGGSGIIDEGNACIVNSVFRHITSTSIPDLGSPVYAARTINTMSGFIMGYHADIEIPCTDIELESIKNYIEGGFFYE